MPPRKKVRSEAVAGATAETPPAPPTEPSAPAAATAEAHEPPPAASPDGPRPAKAWAPKGPLWFQSVGLSNEADGPRMRLGRDNRFQQMAIAFDEKPTAEARRRLHADGWKWRPAEGQWTKQLEIDRRARGQQDAEKLFDELTRIERQDRHLSETVGAIRH